MRTPGGHRRFELADIETISHRLGAQSTRLAHYAADVRDRIELLVMTGNDAGIVELVGEMVRQGMTLPAILDHDLMPCIRKLLQEHTTNADALALHCLVRVFSQLSLPVKSKRRRNASAIGCAVGQSADFVASRGIEAALRSVRINALHLDEPSNTSDLISAALHQGTRSVWLACLRDDALGELSERIQDVQAKLPPALQLLVYAPGPVAGVTNNSQTVVSASLQALCAVAVSLC